MTSDWIACCRGQVRGLLFRVAMSLGRTDKRGAFVISDVGDSIEASARAVRLKEVLAFVEAYAPLHLARWEKLFERILIVPGDAPMGTYYHEINTCGISGRHLMADTLVSTAMTLAHEATHAQLERRGIRYGSHNRDRVERICTMAEIDLATRLPDAGQELTMARRALEAMPWQYSDRHHRRRHVLSILKGE